MGDAGIYKGCLNWRVGYNTKIERFTPAQIAVTRVIFF